MKTHEKQIGVLIGKLACNDIHLAEACKLIQEQLDLLKLKAWKQGMTDAATMVGDGQPADPNPPPWKILNARDAKTSL